MKRKVVVLAVAGISKRYGRKTVLDSVSFSARAGEIVGLLGPSGCGKSTLVKIILGIVGPDAGSVRLHCRPSYVPQQDSIYPALTVRENLDYFYSIAGRRIESSGLGLDQGTLAGSLSGGERKRLSILAGMAGGRELVILDEPTVGLDPLSKREVLDYLHSLKRAGSCVIVVTHHMGEAAGFDRVLLLSKGRLVEDGAPGKLAKKHKAKSMEEVFIRVVSPGEP